MRIWSVALVVATGMLTWVGIAATRRYALRNGPLDVPNARSSHSVPTPRGAGLAVASAVLLGIASAAAFGWIDGRLALGLCVGGAIVAVVGWLDDLRSLPASARLVVHTGVGVWTVTWFYPVHVLHLGFASFAFGSLGWVASVLGIVWAVNLYNFMDGIDGIAGGQALVASLAAAGLLAWSGETSAVIVTVIIGAASLAFLLWNWPPARIFLGDVGSGFLGYVFAALVIVTDNRGALPVLAWSLLFGVFIFDASVTLVRRLLNGDAISAPHRDHAYQRVVVSGLPQGVVSAGVIVISSGLALLAWIGIAHPPLLAPAWLVGYAVLAGLYMWVERRVPFGAKTPQPELDPPSDAIVPSD